MKTIFYLLLVVTVSTLLLNSCTDEPEIKNISGEVVYYSDCKTFEGMYRGPVTPDTLSCIEYVYDEDNNLLKLNHINAGFNCCPGKITCTITIVGDTIVIKESEEASLCNCNCLFDVDMELKEVEKKSYFIKVIEPYCGDQEKLYFEVDFQNAQEGKYCANRKDYPWGMIW